MTTVVVPFREEGKSRLPVALRSDLALAMLADVLAAATSFADRVRLVTSDDAALRIAIELGVPPVADLGGGQGAAVLAGLVGLEGHCVIVNADLPAATPAALAVLATAGAAFVAAKDGTTNALSLPEPGWFQPVYGPGSAARFAAVGLVRVSVPELEQDVDTVADLESLAHSVGPRTTLVLSQHKLTAAAPA